MNSNKTQTGQEIPEHLAVQMANIVSGWQHSNLEWYDFAKTAEGKQLISSLLQNNSAHPDWKEAFIQHFVNPKGESVLLLGQSGAEEIINWISQNVPSQGYSLEQVEKIAKTFLSWFMNDGTPPGGFKQWSQTDQGKTLLKL